MISEIIVMMMTKMVISGNKLFVARWGFILDNVKCVWCTPAGMYVSAFCVLYLLAGVCRGWDWVDVLRWMQLMGGQAEEAVRFTL